MEEAGEICYVFHFVVLLLVPTLYRKYRTPRISMLFLTAFKYRMRIQRRTRLIQIEYHV